ncbi:MAG: acyl-CoA dehydrogenase family protein [Acidobacteriota bacterium]|nr:acyl-CoA dehydrogenase family protein [Acidobacteriota bacterium]
MDFSLTKEQIALKVEFEAFFREEMKNAPPDIGHVHESDAAFDFHRYMMKRLGEKGWIAISWPEEYGGSGRPLMDHYLFNTVRASFGAPGIDQFGAEMYGPTVLLAGSEEQKKRLLPPIARGEVVYCQGWSEPNSGSDLASLKTSAKRDGDHYVVNGQKIWNTGGNRADRIFMLARTNPEEPRGKGLSIFSADMRSEGIEVRPIEYMDGRGEVYNYNEVWFTNVRIPAEDRIGPENAGWKITRETMNFERSGIGGFIMVEQMLEKLVDYCKSARRNGKLLAEDPSVRLKLAEIYAELQAKRTIADRIAWLQDSAGSHKIPPHYASEGKVMGTELIQKVTYLATELLGRHGQVTKSEWTKIKGVAESFYMCVGANIYAGSNEIQRNITAWAGLGLPRFS